MKSQLTLKNYASENRLVKRRIQVIVAIIILLAFGLIFRLIELQVIHFSKYRNLALKNQIEIVPVPPRRGLIYDRHGKLLAKNKVVYTLVLRPDHTPDIPGSIQKLQSLINLTPKTLKNFNKTRQHHSPHDPIPLKYELTPQERAKFYVHQYEFPGISIQARLIRDYPYSKTLAHVLGYVGRISASDLLNIQLSNYSATDYIGKTGIEKAFESQLHGQTGYQEVEVNAQGQVIKTLNEMPPKSGDSIYLTIDQSLQSKAESLLKGHRGAIVGIEPQTGEILTLVSSPTYDPNQFVHGMSQGAFTQLQNTKGQPLYNRAVHGQFPPGSTIKPFYALHALSQRLITPQYYINDRGWFKLPNSNHIYHDWRPWGHQKVNVTKAIIVSCDTFFYNLAVKMSIQQIQQALKMFGFGRQTGIALIGEQKGLVPSPQWKLNNQGQPWYKGDTVITGIGQGFLLVTPLQLAQATTVLANRGQYIPAHLLLKTQQKQHITPFRAKPHKIGLASSHKAWNTIIEAMQKVITSQRPMGTAVRFGRHPKYTVAGKTGTAQVYRPAKYKHQPYWKVPQKYWHHSLFIAFAPVKHPRIALAVIVEHDPHARAQSIARKLLDYYLIEDHHG